MRFKNYQDYVDQREALIAKAQTALSNGNMEDYTAATKEVTELDNAWEEFAKAQANLAALSGSRPQNLGTPMFGKGGILEIGDVTEKDIHASTEYRIAFANYIATGKAIPAKFLNLDESTTTGDVASVIPTTIVPRLVETMEKIGMIYPLLTQTNYKTGVQIPTSSVKPVATRVAEGASSDRQKKTTSYISFSKFKLRCEISWSMEVNEMTLPLFEAAFVRQVSDAMVKKVESEALSTADGTTSCKGILAETPATGQALTAKNIDIRKTC